ncbi:uncharacterized protein LOC115985110 [Quercus lobata]|uniref:uncharacterized protein LOC115985110 n=1 Tax=Quercus lobata TaxID=97700 RepID=UPI001243CA6A|nr:uncharacterized protein LOC115985110 [Quercus lobata]
MLLEKIASYAKNYIRNLKNLEFRQPRSQNSVNKKWKPPLLNSYKTNFDGAMFNESDEVGIGVVIRNCKGELMAALLEKIQKPQSVVALEMLAARRAALFACECGFQQSSFEGDSELVIKALRYGEMQHSSVGHILKDTMSYASCFQSCSFFHMGRQGNSIAHALAQRARLSFPIVVWMESVPLDIMSFVMSDISSIE